MFVAVTDPDGLSGWGYLLLGIWAFLGYIAFRVQARELFIECLNWRLFKYPFVFGVLLPVAVIVGMTGLVWSGEFSNRDPKKQ